MMTRFIGLLGLGLLCVSVHAASVPFDLKIGNPIPGVNPVPNEFMGFSVEVNHIIDYLADAEKGAPNPRPSLVNLFGFLQQASGGASPTLRVGGNSADCSWYNPDGTPNPTNVTYSFNDTLFHTIKAFADVVPGKTAVSFGTTMRGQGKNMSWGVDEVKALGQSIGWDGMQIEVGNENDLFGESGIRGPSWSFSEYLTQYGQYYDAYTAAGMPEGIIQGATFAGHAAFVDGVPELVQEYAKTMETLSLHHYPTSVCRGKPTPPISDLLEEANSGQSAQRYLSDIAACRAAGIPFVLGEANSCSCGGAHGLSDVFASTLWGVAYSLGFANASTNHLNFHGGTHGWYTPLAFTPGSNVPTVRPLYYAMWLVSEATANNARLLDVSVSTTFTNVVAWALRDTKNVTRVVIVHKQLEGSDAEVTVAGDWSSSAELLLMTNPGGVSAETGIDYAGQTFDGSTDGTPVGSRSPKAVSAGSGGYTFTVPALSVAMLVIPPQ